MFPAAHRLRTAADFRETTRRGIKVPRGSVVVYLVTGDGDQPARVGVVVSKSVGGSVERHRAARRIRGAVRPLVDLLPSGSRVVVRALPGADTDRQLADSVASGIQQALTAPARRRAS